MARAVCVTAAVYPLRWFDRLTMSGKGYRYTVSGTKRKLRTRSQLLTAAADHLPTSLGLGRRYRRGSATRVSSMVA